MDHLHLRYEGAAIMPLPAFSDIGIWDIVDRAPVFSRREIEKMLDCAIKQGVTMIQSPGIKPMSVDNYADGLFGRWNRMVLTIIDVDRTSPVGWYAWVTDYVT
jgi:hypothetical protein